MARIRLHLPDEFPFSTDIPVRITDINYGGHLAHDAVLSLTHEARVRFLSHLGYTEGDIEGSAVIMADAAVVYKNEGRYGQTLRVDVGPGEIGRKGFDLYYRLRDVMSYKEVAEVKTGLVFFDYHAGAVRDVPSAFRERMAAL